MRWLKPIWHASRLDQSSLSRLVPWLATLCATSESFAAAPHSGVQLGEEIRWVFVGFLFAFVISEIAARFARLFNSWRENAFAAPTFLHLFLALTIVITSWLGWSLAVVSGVYPSPLLVIEPATGLFFIDVAILVSYHALVSGINVEVVGESAPPAVTHVLFWLVVIFAGYFVWDTWLMVVEPRAGGWGHAVTSAIFCLTTFLCYVVVKDIRDASQDKWLVCTVDSALICLVIAFRLVKFSIPWPPEPEKEIFVTIACILLFTFLGLLAYARSRLPAAPQGSTIE
jgi:hypothetical protein